MATVVPPSMLPLLYMLALSACDSGPSVQNAALLPASADPFANIGATPFFPSDLATYCDGSDQLDDTGCIGEWLADGKSMGQHLYASPGTYLYRTDRRLFNGVHIRCADPETTVFRNTAASSAKFILDSQFGGGPYPYSDISIENCGFDINGATNNFASVIIINGGGADASTWARNITIRGNLFFDSTQPGGMFIERNRQRQYIVILAAQDVLIEGNVLSEGGRIKAGRPGARIVIRNNTLHNINDNGITVVNSGDHSGAYYLIEGNEIVNALGSGIFFGADGEAAGTALQGIADIVIRNNRVSGGQQACIHGTLPNHAQRILIEGNICEKVGSAPTYSGTYDRGIGITRAAASTLPIEGLTIQGNTVTSATQFRVSALYVSGWHAGTCILDNRFQIGTRSAMRLSGDVRSVMKLDGNVLNGGTVRKDGSFTLVQSGDRAGCWMP